MTITVDWYDTNERIILFTMSKKWSVDEFTLAVEKANGMSIAVSHNNLVYTIVDLREGSLYVPRNIIGKIREMVLHQPLNLGLTIIVAQSGFVYSLMNILTKASLPVVKDKMRGFVMVGTFEEAEQRIQTLIEEETKPPSVAH